VEQVQKLGTLAEQEHVISDSANLSVRILSRTYCSSLVPFWSPREAEEKKRFPKIKEAIGHCSRSTYPFRILNTAPRNDVVVTRVQWYYWELCLVWWKNESHRQWGELLSLSREGKSKEASTWEGVSERLSCLRILCLGVFIEIFTSLLCLCVIHGIYVCATPWLSQAHCACPCFLSQLTLRLWASYQSMAYEPFTWFSSFKAWVSGFKTPHSLYLCILSLYPW
jgi:hypothetical protein